MKQKQKRTVHYSFKVTPEEGKVIQQKVKAFGLKNQSTFLRAMALKGYLLKLNLPEIKEAIRLLGIMSNNVNQIAVRLHERGSVYETEMDEIADRQDELSELMKRILQRLDEIQM